MIEQGGISVDDEKVTEVVATVPRAAFEKSWEDSLWAHTLDTIMPDKEEQAYLQKWAGYMLWGGAPEEKLLFLYGPGGTGKGTFINTIAYALGDYADVINVEVLLASRNDAHAGGAAASPTARPM